MTGADLSMMSRRTIAADAARLFALWTEPDLLRRWWGPAGVVCPEASIDLRVGGRYRIGNLLPNGRTVWIEGEFLAIEPPRLLVYTWVVGTEPASQVSVRFEPRAAGTEIVVIHERIASAAVRDDHAAGWRGCLDGLAACAETGAVKTA